MKLYKKNVFGDISGLPESQLAILSASTHVSLMMDVPKLLSIINPFLNPEPAPGRPLKGKPL